MKSIAAAVAVVGVWVSVSAMVIGLAVAWGHDGRNAVIGLAVFGYTMAMFATAGMSPTKADAEKAKVTDA